MPVRKSCSVSLYEISIWGLSSKDVVVKVGADNKMNNCNLAMREVWHIR